MLNVALLLFFDRRKIKPVAFGNKSESFFVDVNVLHYITGCSMFYNEIADPHNLQKLVFVIEKELRIATKFL